MYQTLWKQVSWETAVICNYVSVLSRTTDKINRISNHVCDRWRHYHVLNLRETQQTSKLNIKSWKDAPDVLGELPLTDVLPSRDTETRGAIVRIAKTSKILKRSVNKLFPTENGYQDINQTGTTREQKLRWEAALIGELKGK